MNKIWNWTLLGTGALLGFCVGILVIGGFLWSLYVKQESNKQETALVGECGFMVTDPDTNEIWYNVISGKDVTVTNCGYASMLFNKYSSVKAVVVEDYPIEISCTRTNEDGTIDNITAYEPEIGDKICERVKDLGYK